MLPRAFPKAPSVTVVPMNLTAELDGVLAGGVGNVVDELGDGIRPLELRPFETTQAGKEVAAKPDAGQSARVRTRDAGVETVS